MEALRSLKGMRGASIISFPAPMLLPEWIWDCSYGFTLDINRFRGTGV